MVGCHSGEAQQFLYAAGNLVVEMPVGILCPGVEMPVGDGDASFAVAHEDGAGVAGPYAVGGPLVKADVIEIGAGAAEDTLGAALLLSRPER